MEQTAGDNVVVNSDGSRTAYYEVPTDSEVLERLMREIFEQHWDGWHLCRAHPAGCRL